MNTSTALRLFLIRHGETVSNRSFRFVGTGEEGLTEHGRRQAEEIGAALAGLSLDGLLTSPLRRTAETAAAIARHTRLAVTVEPRLREQDYGAWEGLTGSEVESRGGEERRRFERWMADPRQAPPGGESLTGVGLRMAALIEELAAHHGGGSWVLVSHVGPIKALLCDALGMPLEAGLRLFLDPGTLSVVDWQERPVVRLFNACPHPGLCEARWLEG